MRRITIAFLTTSTILFTHCGSDSASNVKLFVGQLGNNPAANTAIRRAVTPGTVASAVPSNTDYSYAVIDGLKLRMKGIDFSGASANTSISFDNREVVLGDGVANVNIDTAVSAAAGNYTSARVRLDNGYEIQGFCRTNDKLVYTTPAGIVAKNCTNGGVGDCTIGSDYGYKRYEFAYITTSQSHTDTTDELNEETRDPMTITAGTTIQLLVDTRFTVTCYDGTGTTGIMNPFNWGPRNGVLTDYFPANQPNFGLSYVPVFTAVSNDGTFPTPETYMAARPADAGELIATNPDFKKLHILTLAFKSDGEILAARGRNFEAPTGLSQMYGTFVKTGALYDMFNGEWALTKSDDPSYTGGPVFDRKVNGWKRLALAEAAHATTISDGPDAGNATFLYEGMPRARAPIATTSDPTSLSWKRLQ